MDISKLKEIFPKIENIDLLDLNKREFKNEIENINDIIESIVTKQQIQNKTVLEIISIESIKKYYNKYKNSRDLLDYVTDNNEKEINIALENNGANDFIINEHALYKKKLVIFNKIVKEIKNLIDEDKQYYLKDDNKISKIISLETEYNKTCIHQYEQHYNIFNNNIEYLDKKTIEQDILKETIDNLKNMKPNKDCVRKVIDSTGKTCFYSDNNKKLTQEYMINNVIKNTLPNSGQVEQIKNIYPNKKKTFKRNTGI